MVILLLTHAILFALQAILVEMIQECAIQDVHRFLLQIPQSAYV